MDLISRQAAIDAINSGIVTDDDGVECPSECNSMLEWAVNAVKELPTAQKTGKWNEEPNEDWAGGGAWVCSNCGWGYAFGAYHEAFEFNYCPNCGARMEE